MIFDIIWLKERKFYLALRNPVNIYVNVYVQYCCTVHSTMYYCPHIEHYIFYTWLSHPMAWLSNTILRGSTPEPGRMEANMTFQFSFISYKYFLNILSIFLVAAVRVEPK